MEAVFMTKEEFLALGFRPEYFRTGLVKQLGGKKVKVVAVEDHERGDLVVTRGGRNYLVKDWMLRDYADFDKIKNPPFLEIDGQKVSYILNEFSFPCSFRNLDVKRARKVAQWILKVSK